MDAFPLRFGQDRTIAAPGVNDLWLPQFGGEVLAAFDENLVASQIVRMLSMSSGNSMEFPMLHKMSAERHAAGAYISGQDVATGKRTITLDQDPLIAAFELTDVDKAKSHFEITSEMAKQAGQALAREMDMNALQLGCNASRTAADAGASPFNGGGYQVDPDTALSGADWVAPVADSAPATDTIGTFPTSATARGIWGKNQALTLLSGIEAVGVQWDQRNIPVPDRNVVVQPGAFHALKNLGLPTDKATTSTLSSYLPFAGGPQFAGGDLRPGVLQFNSFKIWLSPNLPYQNITTGESKYRGDFRKVRALVIQKNAVGMINFMGVQTVSGRDIRTDTDLFYVKMLYGGRQNSSAADKTWSIQGNPSGAILSHAA